MKVYINKFLILLVGVLSFMEVSQASDVVPDIRYRTIVYFYPDTEAIDDSLFRKEFKNFDVVDELPKSSLKPLVSHTIVREVNKLYPVPDLSYLSYFGRGLNKQQATRIQESNLAIVIDIAYPLNMSYRGLNAATKSIFRYSESTGGLIWDSETRELFTPEAWKEKRFGSWSGNTPNVENHTVIHAYKNNEGVRAITLGMVKFGLPDIVVNDFSWSLNRPMGNLINLVAQSISEGFIPNQ